MAYRFLLPPTHTMHVSLLGQQQGVQMACQGFLMLANVTLVHCLCATRAGAWSPECGIHGACAPGLPRVHAPCHVLFRCICTYLAPWWCARVGCVLGFAEVCVFGCPLVESPGHKSQVGASPPPDIRRVFVLASFIVVCCVRRCVGCVLFMGFQALCWRACVWCGLVLVHHCTGCRVCCWACRFVVARRVGSCWGVFWGWLSGGVFVLWRCAACLRLGGCF